MSCSSCSTGKDGGIPTGCRSNGTCGTGGCNKLNVYNWLVDMTLPSGQQPYDIIEVRFKGSRKEFFRNKENIELKTGDVVAVESSPGHDIGVVSMKGELVRFQLRKKHLQENSDQIKTLYRKARQADIDKWNEVKDKEAAMLNRTRIIVQAMKLNMKLGDVDFQGDGKKATFYYTAEDRVDFRELIKKLAEEFRIRVEMKQIGVRQEASRMGGIGICGRELCCSTWLTDFKAVTTGAARYQNLSLNPAKLAGQCGKLKCCLNYELDSYVDAIKDFPSTNAPLQTEKGLAFHRKTDIFKRTMWFAYGGSLEGEKAEVSEGNDGGNWVPVSVDRVKEIVAMNKENQKPAELRDENEEIEIDDTPDFENVVGQDRIDRMDRKKKHKKKKRKGGQGGGSMQRPETGQTQSGQQPRNNPPQNKPQQNKQRQPSGGQQRNQQQQNRPQQGGEQKQDEQKNNQPRPIRQYPQRQRPPRNNPPPTENKSE